MAVYLPIFTALLATTGTATALRSIAVALALAVVAAVLIAALRHGHLINRAVPIHAGSEVLLLGVFGLALLVAGLAQAVHVSARSVRSCSVSRSRVRSPSWPAPCRAPA